MPFYYNYTFRPSDLVIKHTYTKENFAYYYKFETNNKLYFIQSMNFMNREMFLKIFQIKNYKKITFIFLQIFDK